MMITKQVNTSVAAVGECVTYTITVTNEKNYNIEDVGISDTLTTPLKFVEGSLKLNGRTSEGDIISGINIGGLGAKSSETKVIEFNALIVCAPREKLVKNIASGTYSYLDPITGKKHYAIEKSIPCSLTVLCPELEIIKAQSQDQVSLGDRICYTITLFNSGDLELVNVLVRDALSTALELVPGSIMLDQQVIHVADLNQGINIPIIEVGKVKQLKYQVIVCGGSSEEIICSYATAMTTYILPDCTKGTKCFSSNSVGLNIGMHCFRQFLLQKHLSITPYNEGMEEIDEVVAEVSVLEEYVICTPIGTSCEGQILTGHKLIVNGNVSLDVSYITNNREQSVHFIHYELPFSTFMVLPIDYKEKMEVGVTGQIEDVYYEVHHCRCFYIALSILIEGKVLK